MANSLAALEELQAEVAHADRPDLALVHETAHLAPGVLDRRSGFIRPVDLVQVYPLHLETAE